MAAVKQTPQPTVRVRWSPAQRLDRDEVDAVGVLGKTARDLFAANLLAKRLANGTPANDFPGLAISGFWPSIAGTNVNIKKGMFIGADGRVLSLVADTTEDLATYTTGANKRGFYAFLYEVKGTLTAKRFWNGSSEITNNTDTRWTTAVGFHVGSEVASPADTVSVTDLNGESQLATRLFNFTNVLSVITVSELAEHLFTPVPATGTLVAGSTVGLGTGDETDYGGTYQNIGLDERSLEEFAKDVRNVFIGIKGGGRTWFNSPPITLNAIRQSSALGLLNDGGVVASIGGLNVSISGASLAGGHNRYSSVASLASLTLPDNSTCYVDVDESAAGAPVWGYSLTAAGALNGSNQPVAIVTTLGGVVTEIRDCRLFYTGQDEGAYTVSPFVGEQLPRRTALGGANFKTLQAGIEYIALCDAASVQCFRTLRVVEPLTVAAPIVMRGGNITIEGGATGCGPGGFHVIYNFKDSDLFSFNGQDNVEVRNLRIEHILGGATSADYAVFGLAGTIERLTLRDIWVKNTSARLRGFVLVSTGALLSRFTMERCYVEVSDFGLYMAGTATWTNSSSSRIAGNRFVKSATAGANIFGIHTGAANTQPSSLSISDNEIDAFDVGIYVRCYDVQVRGNTIRSAPVGIELAANQLQILDNRIFTASTAGIRAQNGIELVNIDGNQLDGCALGISVTGASNAPESIVIARNNLRGCTSDAIALGGALGFEAIHCTITGNVAVTTGAAASAILLNGEFCTVTGNACRCPGGNSYGINVYSTNNVVSANAVYNSAAYTGGTAINLGVTTSLCIVSGNSTNGASPGADAPGPQVNAALIADAGTANVKRLTDVINTGAVAYRPLNT